MITAMTPSEINSSTHATSLRITIFPVVRGRTSTVTGRQRSSVHFRLLDAPTPVHGLVLQELTGTSGRGYLRFARSASAILTICLTQAFILGC